MKEKKMKFISGNEMDVIVDFETFKKFPKQFHCFVPGTVVQDEDEDCFLIVGMLEENPCTCCRCANDTNPVFVGYLETDREVSIASLDDAKSWEIVN